MATQRQGGAAERLLAKIGTYLTNNSQTTQLVDRDGDLCDDATNNAIRVSIVSGTATLSVNLDAADDEVLTYGSSDGGTTRQPVHTDASGDVQVDVLTSALPTGAATSANQTTANTALAAIQTAVETIDNAIAGTEMQVDVLTVPAPLSVVGGGLEATAMRVTLASDSTGVISVDDNAASLTVDAPELTTLAGAVAGTEMQVDIVTSALPTGAATAANQTTANTALAAIQTAVETIDNAIAGTEMQVDVVAALPAGANMIGLVQPFSAVLEGGLTELIGINEQVDLNEFSASVGVTLAGTYSGEILGITLIQTEDGAGAIIGLSGTLFIFDADPTIANGAASVGAAAAVTCIGTVSFTATDWVTDTTAGVAYKTVAIPFHAVGTLFFAYKHTGATSFNDVAGDDEQLEFNFWYRRDS